MKLRRPHRLRWPAMVAAAAAVVAAVGVAACAGGGGSSRAAAGGGSTGHGDGTAAADPGLARSRVPCYGQDSLHLAYDLGTV